MLPLSVSTMVNANNRFVTQYPHVYRQNQGNFQQGTSPATSVTFSGLCSSGFQCSTPTYGVPQTTCSFSKPSVFFEQPKQKASYSMTRDSVSCDDLASDFGASSPANAAYARVSIEKLRIMEGHPNLFPTPPAAFASPKFSYQRNQMCQRMLNKSEGDMLSPGPGAFTPVGSMSCVYPQFEPPAKARLAQRIQPKPDFVASAAVPTDYFHPYPIGKPLRLTSKYVSKTDSTERIGSSSSMAALSSASSSDRVFFAGPEMEQSIGDASGNPYLFGSVKRRGSVSAMTQATAFNDVKAPVVFKGSFADEGASYPMDLIPLQQPDLQQSFRCSKNLATFGKRSSFNGEATVPDVQVKEPKQSLVTCTAFTSEEQTLRSFGDIMQEVNATTENGQLETEEAVTRFDLQDVESHSHGSFVSKVAPSDANVLYTQGVEM